MKFRHLALAAAACAVLTACAAGGPPRDRILVESPRVLDQTAMQSAALLAHNEERERLGLPLLVLDAGLSTDALAYANELAATGKWEHSAVSSRPGQGENLWRGTVGRFSYEQMVAPWMAERRFYKPGAFPDVSKTGRVGDVGHYTQAVWRDTTRMGCGIASGLGRDVLVCRYNPPGNVNTQRPY